MSCSCLHHRAGAKIEVRARQWRRHACMIPRTSRTHGWCTAAPGASGCGVVCPHTAELSSTRRVCPPAAPACLGWLGSAELATLWVCDVILGGAIMTDGSRPAHHYVVEPARQQMSHHSQHTRLPSVCNRWFSAGVYAGARMRTLMGGMPSWNKAQMPPSPSSRDTEKIMTCSDSQQ